MLPQRLKPAILRHETARLKSCPPSKPETQNSKLEARSRLGRSLLWVGEHEIEHQLVVVGGFFDLGKMAAVAEHFQPGIGDAFVQSFSVPYRRERVFAAPNKQR